MLSVKDAELLRESKYRLGVKLSDIKKQREFLDDRSDKIQNTKSQQEVLGQLDLIEEQLEDAPPEPLNPHVALRHVRQHFLDYIRTYQKNKQELMKRFNKYEFNISDTLSWQLTDICIAEETAKIAYKFLKLSYKGDNDIENLFNVHNKVDEWVKDETEDLIHSARSGIGRSTSHSANVVEEAKTAGIASMLCDFTRWMWRTYKKELEMVKSWIELQNEQ